MDFWTAVQHLSDIVSIIGIPTVVVGVWALTRRPNIEVGFLSSEGTDPVKGKPALDHARRIQLGPGPDDGFSTATVEILVVNRGRATARDLVLNFYWPGDDDWASYHPIPDDPNADYQFDPVLKRPFTLLDKRDFLHEHDYFKAEFPMPVRSSMRGLDIPWTVSTSGSRSKGNLTVTFVREG